MKCYIGRVRQQRRTNTNWFYGTFAARCSGRPGGCCPQQIIAPSTRRRLFTPYFKCCRRARSTTCGASSSIVSVSAPHPLLPPLSPRRHCNVKQTCDLLGESRPNKNKLLALCARYSLNGPGRLLPATTLSTSVCRPFKESVMPASIACGSTHG